jgi:hypothetical protein
MSEFNMVNSSLHKMRGKMILQSSKIVLILIKTMLLLINGMIANELKTD